MSLSTGIRSAELVAVAAARSLSPAAFSSWGWGLPYLRYQGQFAAQVPDKIHLFIPCASTCRLIYVEATGMPDLPQGTLDLLILKVATLGPIHGYAIAQRIQQISREALQVQQGSLYPALHRLENKSLLEAEWKQSETGREAKYYRLTAKGRDQLRLETENWARVSEAVSLILQIAGGEPQ
jgi:PadR family transcriptional regulator PadR